MTTNAEQAFWKFWQATTTALSWTFLGATGGGAEISLGGAAPLLPWNRPWQNVKQNAAGLRCFLREDGISLA